MSSATSEFEQINMNTKFFGKQPKVGDPKMSRNPVNQLNKFKFNLNLSTIFSNEGQSWLHSNRKSFHSGKASSTPQQDNNDLKAIMASLEQQNHGNHPDGMPLQYSPGKMITLNHSVDLNKGLVNLRKPHNKFNSYNMHSPALQGSGSLQLHPQVTQLAPKQG